MGPLWRGVGKFFLLRMSPVSTRICVPNLVAVRRSCRKKGGGGTDRQTDRQRKLQLYIEVSQSRDILTSHVFVTPYWRSSQSLPDTLSYGADIIKVFI